MTVPYQDMGSALAGLSIGPCTARIDSLTAAQDIEFGYPVFSYAGSKLAYPYLADTAKVVFSGDFVTSNTVIVTVNSVASATVTFASNTLTTMNLVVDALNAMTGVEAFRDTTDGTNRTVYIRTIGAAITVATTVALGASQATSTKTYSSAQVFVGLALRTMMPSAGTAKYLAKDEVNVLERGKLWAETSTSAVSNVAAYVGSTGKLANAGTAINCVFRGNRTGAGLVEVEVNGQTAFTNSNSF